MKKLILLLLFATPAIAQIEIRDPYRDSTWFSYLELQPKTNGAIIFQYYDITQGSGAFRTIDLYKRATSLSPTPITAMSYLPTASRVVKVTASVFAASLTYPTTTDASYELVALFNVTNTGIVTQIGTTKKVYALEGNSAMDSDISTDGTNINVTATGIGGQTIQWLVFSRISTCDTTNAN